MIKTLDKLAVIILNYNSSELSIAATKNILDLKMGAKIVVVDNCSTDHSQEVLDKEFGNVENVYLEFSKSNKGYAAGNNIGIRAAERLDVDTVLIMNPDIEVPEAQILYEMYACLEGNNDIGAVTVKTIFNGAVREPNECAWKFMTPQYMMFDATILGKFFVKPQFLKKEDCSDEITYVDVVQGCFFMIRLENIRAVGYLDEHTFLYYEESILAKRLEKIDKKNAVLTDFYIKHDHREKNKRLVKYKNKLFDMKCFYESRMYYIDTYSMQSPAFNAAAKLILNFDFMIKKVLLSIIAK